MTEVTLVTACTLLVMRAGFQSKNREPPPVRNLPALALFYFPLAVTSVPTIVTWTLIAIGSSCTAEPDSSLAAWPVALSILWPLATPIQMLQQPLIIVDQSHLRGFLIARSQLAGRAEHSPNLLNNALPFVGILAPDSCICAGIQIVVEYHLIHLLNCLLHGHDLLDNIDAAIVVLDQELNASYVLCDASQVTANICLHFASYRFPTIHMSPYEEQIGDEHQDGSCAVKPALAHLFDLH